MARPVTLFTGQWADMPFEELCKKASEFGYDGLEIAASGDHLDVEKAAKDPEYVKAKKETLAKYGLKTWAISVHLQGQLVCDLNDKRAEAFAPAETHGDPERMRAWAVEQVKYAAQAAHNLGVEIITGFTGSSIWPMWYSFPPTPESMIEEGFAYFAKMWNPILDVFDQYGVKFALEVHPTEIAFDIVTAERALKAIGGRKAFGFNFDPSHLLWQGMNPAQFIREFPDRIYHVHMKDVAVRLDGRSGILGSHLDFGQAGRGWDFRSLGRGDVDFEDIIRELNRIGYQGPLSVEWEDSGMDREHGAREACEFVRNLEFPPSDRAFDAAFSQNR